MTSLDTPSVLIFGQHGQLARALIAPAQRSGLKTQTAGRQTADLSQPGQSRSLILSCRPAYVINAAAYTAVDRAETDISMCHALNASAPEEMAASCAEIGARFVHVSTDYVFDGQAETPYLENDVVSPLNVYGQSKADGECAVLAANPDAAIVRTSAVFSGGGTDFPSKIWSAAESRDELTVVDDQLTGPTSAWSLAERLVALCQSQDTGLFHCAGHPFVSWASYAEYALELSAARNGPSAHVVHAPSQPDPERASRPKAARLGGHRLEQATGLSAPDWRADLAIALDAWMTNR